MEDDKNMPLVGPRAADYFHLMPYNWNCAQSIHKAAQSRTGLTDEEIELRYRSKGGGRAEGGLCGAIYAVRSIVGEGTDAAERLTERFRELTGGLTCSELKGKHGRPCSYLVEVAQGLLDNEEESK